MTVPATMRAVVLAGAGGPDVLRVAELPVPEPRAAEVLVRVAASGVCGKDVLTRRGELPARPDLVMGHEVAGVVVAAGSAVRRLAVGDRVASLQRQSCHACRFCRAGRDVLCEEPRLYGDDVPGGYAEYVAMDEHSLARVPDAVDFPAAAIAGCGLGTAFRALRLARVEVGLRVMVTGASGGVGIHALQLARAMGAETVAVTSSPAKATELDDVADAVIVAPDGRFDRQARERALQPHVVLEMTAAYTLEESLRAVQRGGAVVIAGNMASGSVGIVPGAFIVRELTLLGSVAATRDELERCLALLARGRVTARVHATLPLEDAPRAHALMESRATRGRVVLVPQP